MPRRPKGVKAGVMLALAGLALGAVAVSAAAWWVTGPSKITPSGYVALALCLVLGGALTVGLMWLMFFSANHGFDDIDRE